MPTDGRTQTYGFLDQLSTEQLLNLLRADFDSSEDGDDEQIFQILEVLKSGRGSALPILFPTPLRLGRTSKHTLIPRTARAVPFIQ